MYTQCPECETTFRLSAEDLRRANGKVRCGDCQTVFNALEYLAEEVAEEGGAGRLSRWTSSTANPHGSLDIDDLTAEDLEALAEDDEEEERGGILYIAPDDTAETGSKARQPAVDNGADDVADDDKPADATTTDDDAGDDYAGAIDTGDFDEDIWDSIPGVDLTDETGEAEDWQSEHAEAGPADEWQPESADDDTDAVEADAIAQAAAVAATDDETDEPAAGTDDDDLEFDVPGDKWSNFFGPLPKGQRAAIWQPPALDETDADHHPDADVAAEATPDDSDSAADEADVEAVGPVFSVSDDTDADAPSLPDDFAAATQVDEDTTDAPGPRFPQTYADEEAAGGRSPFWTIALLLGAVFLVGQLLHYNRDSLAAHPAWGENVRALYASLGAELYPLWSIDDYEIRASEAVAGESGQDVLDIRAQIAAIGKQPAGMPRLRVVLRDRWANPVAAQDFAPAEYADPAALPADGLLQPGDVINAHVSILDPGSGAQGFELELCLPRRFDGLECSGQPFK